MSEDNRIAAAMDRAGMDPGLYRKFRVERVDGSSGDGGKHQTCTYLVLDWRHDPFAVPAARAYADACEATYPELARDLRVKARDAELLHQTRDPSEQALEELASEAQKHGLGY